MSSDDTATPLPGSDVVRAALQQALEDYGRRLAEDPARLRAVLNDALGSGSADCRAAVDAVVLAAEQGVVADLVLRRGQAPDAAADAAATAELGRWGLAAGTAGWVVTTWETVLRGAGSLPAAGIPIAVSAPQPDEVPPTAPPPLAETAAPPALAETAPPPALAETAPPPLVPTALPPTSSGDPDQPPPVEEEPTQRRLAGVHRAVLVPVAVVVSLLALAGTGFATGVLGGGSSKAQPPVPNATSSPSSSADSSPSPSASPKPPPSPVVRVTPTPSKPVASSAPPAVALPVPSVTHAPNRAPQVAPVPNTTSTAPTRRRTTSPSPSPTRAQQPPPPPAAPVAESDTTSYTPLACGSDWCVASLAPAASGTWDKLTVLGVSPSSYATAYANGRKISWQPQRNGYATYDIQWYVTNTSTGKRSATATLSVTMQCNRDYQCN